MNLFQRMAQTKKKQPHWKTQNPSPFLTPLDSGENNFGFRSYHFLVEIRRDERQGDVYKLIKGFKVCGICIPGGFESDGASVPRFFWRAVFPPGAPKALRAAFVHDYLYRNHWREWSREKADLLFLLILRIDGIGAWASLTAFAGVRLFGMYAWKKGRECVREYE